MDHIESSQPDDLVSGGQVESDEDDALAPPLPSQRFDAWRRHSSVAALGTGVALGLQHVFSPTDNQPVVSAPIPGDPPDADERIRVTLDPDDPAKSVAVIPPGPNGST